MALKDLLVYVDQTPAAMRRLRLAADLANRHGARLAALLVEECSTAEIEARSHAEMGLASMDQMRRMDERHRDGNHQAAGQLQDALGLLRQQHGLDARLVQVQGCAADVVLQHARHADVTIIGHGVVSANASIDDDFPEQLLFLSGRPVIMIPPAGPETLGRCVALGWNGSRAAARTLHDALPVIERAEHTSVITINGKELLARPGALPVRSIVEHLGQHGATVETIEIDGVARDEIARTLQSRALEIGCDLLIAGAFGHVRLREKLLGGVTENLLLRARLPLMLSQ